MNRAHTARLSQMYTITGTHINSESKEKKQRMNKIKITKLNDFHGYIIHIF